MSDGDDTGHGLPDLASVLHDEAHGAAVGQWDARKAALARGQFPLNATSLAYESLRLVKSGAATLYSFTAYSSKGSAQFIQLFDATSAAALATGAVPVAVFTVAATSHLFIPYPPEGRRFLRGLVIANSSTGPTYTAGSADTYYDVQYV